MIDLTRTRAGLLAEIEAPHPAADPLNDISANESAQERSTIQLAEMIKTRLAAYFAQTAAQPVAAQ